MISSTYPGIVHSLKSLFTSMPTAYFVCTEDWQSDWLCWKFRILSAITTLGIACASTRTWRRYLWCYHRYKIGIQVKYWLHVQYITAGRILRKIPKRTTAVQVLHKNHNRNLFTLSMSTTEQYTYSIAVVAVSSLPVPFCTGPSATGNLWSVKHCISKCDSYGYHHGKNS